MMRSPVPSRNMNPLVEDVDREEKRRHGRIRTQNLIARMGFMRRGTVDNVSASGFALRYKGRARHEVGDQIDLKLQGRKSSIPIKAKVMSVRSNTGETYLGMQFEPFNEAQAEAIRNLAIQTRNWAG